MQDIPIFRPSMGGEEIEEVARVINSRWIGLGPKTGEFEKEFAKYIGVKHAVAVNSATAALHLSLNVLNINSGEVIVPVITFVSTALAPLYNNAKPVFADVYEDTLTMNVDDVKKKITKKTKAIMPVHYAGHPCEMDEINKLAKKHKLKVVEDCAHSTGAEYKGKKTGNLGDLGCFSFHAVKNLATGDGGMITTNSKKIDEKLRRLRWVGVNKNTFERNKKGYDWYYEVKELGFKKHMNDITAAIGLVQLRKLDSMNQRRREIVDAYNDAFKDLDWLGIPVEKDYIKNALHAYVVRVKKRDKFMQHLKKNSISAGVHYMPLHLHPLFKKVKARVPVAEQVWKSLVTLPLFPDLTETGVNKIIDAVKSFKN